MDLLDLFVKIGVKDEASDKISSISSGIKSALGTAAKAAGVALGAATAGAVALTKSAVEGYAEYEQLVGGIETLFGAGGATSVEEYATKVGKTVEEVSSEYAVLEQAQSMALENASNAWKNQGLSANEYMETITSFAASLKQGLGGDVVAAAEKADLALTDMADNANKMGTDISSIQNAYQGFAKQNYTMLDNLKLGYGGTQEEMIRLINDSGILNEKIENLDNISFDQIIDAIHVVQTNLGITGTTANEAATTIQGSVNAMKSAWSNLVVGIADDTADFDSLINDFVQSVDTAAYNILPRIETALQGVASLIEKLAPKLGEMIAELVPTILPSLLSAASSIVSAIGQGLITALPQLMTIATQMVLEFVNYLAENTEQAVDTIVQIVMIIASALITAAPELGKAAGELIVALVTGLVENLPEILQAAGEIILSLFTGLVEAGATLLDAVAQLFEVYIIPAIEEKYAELKEHGSELIDNMIQGIKAKISAVRSAISNIGDNIKSSIRELISTATSWGSDLMNNFIEGIRSKISSLVSSVSNVASTVKSYLGFSEPEEGPLSNFHTYAPDMMKLFAEGIKKNTGVIENAFNNSLKLGTSNLGISSNSYGSSGINGAVQEIVLNITETIDGKVLAKNQYRYLVDEKDRHGMSLITA